MSNLFKKAVIDDVSSRGIPEGHPNSPTDGHRKLPHLS